MCATQKAINPVKVDACLKMANKLLQANNTVTTLEIKKALQADAVYSDYMWDQATVHTIMDNAYQNGKFKIVDDNGTYRTYSATTTPASLLPKRGRGRPRKVMSTSAPVVAPKRGRGRPRKTAVVATPVSTKVKKTSNTKYTYISRKKAIELMENNKGHVFTATFVKKDGTTRTINCQYLKDQTSSKLGYIKVKEFSKLKSGDPAIKQINAQTLLELNIAKGHYKMRK